MIKVVLIPESCHLFTRDGFRFSLVCLKVKFFLEHLRPFWKVSICDLSFKVFIQIIVMVIRIQVLCQLVFITKCLPIKVSARRLNDRYRDI